MARFYWWSSTASRLEPLQGGRQFTFYHKFPEIPGTPELYMQTQWKGGKPRKNIRLIRKLKFIVKFLSWSNQNKMLLWKKKKNYS